MDIGSTDGIRMQLSQFLLMFNEAIASDTTIYAKWSSRKPANWEVRYVDAMGRTLARSIRGTDNLYDVLYKEALNIPGYAVDFSSKNITLSNDDSSNVIEFVYTAKPKPYIE